MIMFQKERQSIEEVEVNVDVVSSIVNSRGGRIAPFGERALTVVYSSIISFQSSCT